MRLPPMSARHLLAGAAVACSAVFVTACSAATPSTPTADTHSATPSKSAASPPASGSSSPAAGSTASPGARSAASPGSSGSGSSGGSVTGSGCLSRYLRGSIGLTQGTAGSVYEAIVFTNLANYTCTLYGYPGVSLAGGTPVAQVGLAATENAATPRELVSLPPGGSANATLQIVDAGNYSAGTCGPVATSWLQVYPPNQTVPLYIKYSSTSCRKAVHLLTVSAARPGTGG
jgi:Protein of unknown function (DUF4232)